MRTQLILIEHLLYARHCAKSLRVEFSLTIITSYEEEISFTLF